LPSTLPFSTTLTSIFRKASLDDDEINSAVLFLRWFRTGSYLGLYVHSD
jgi:hypothetical protein